MSHYVFPSENAIGSYRGVPCNVLLEPNWVAHNFWSKRCPCAAYLCSGFDLSAGTGLQVNIASGSSYHNGFLTGTTGSESLGSLTASNTNYIWQVLTFNADPVPLVTDFTWQANITGTPPTYGLLVGIAVTSGSAVTSVLTMPRDPGSSYSSTYTGDGSASMYVYLGNTPKRVHIHSNSIYSWSGQTTGSSCEGWYQTISNYAANTSDKIYRPELAPLGFIVGVTGITGLNRNGLVYPFTAWF